MEEGGVVHQQVEASLLALDAGEELAHLFVVAVVARHGDTLAAGAGHGLGGFGKAAGKQLATQAAAAFGAGAAAEVNGHAGGAEGNGDTLADATAGTGDQGDARFACSHLMDSLEWAALLWGRIHSPRAAKLPPSDSQGQTCGLLGE
ncbi:hypothetical protein D9M70_569760 [compost metagenome]